MPIYSEILRYLYSLHRFGIKLGLEAITGLLHRLDDPQRGYATIHIGGTNGKGSSAAMVASMLQAGGYRVGLYTSPHLIDFRERIRVNDEDIPEDRVCELTQRIRRVAASLPSLTFFEFTTAMAFQHFLDQAVDIAVVEVGMGGRFDATNVLDPLAILITGIAFDHEKYLGQSLQHIAKEKAGIIKRNTPVVLGAMPENVELVFKRYAKECQSPTIHFGRDYFVLPKGSDSFTYQGFRWTIPDVQINLLGNHQMSNAANSLAVLEAVAEKQVAISLEALRTGLRQVKWKGRLEVIHQEPLIILDGAHNPSAAQVLFDFLYSQIHDYPGRKLTLVVGMMGDKNYRDFLAIILPIVSLLILTQPTMEGAASADDLKRVVNRDDLCPILIPKPWDALCRAKVLATPSDLICVTGSLYLVGEVAQALSQRQLPTI